MATIREAAEAAGLTTTALRWRIRQGYITEAEIAGMTLDECRDKLPRRKQYATRSAPRKSVTPEGYISQAEMADAVGVEDWVMKKWIARFGAPMIRRENWVLMELALWDGEWREIMIAAAAERAKKAKAKQ